MKDLQFNSRRSPIFGTRGIVASSQPIASLIGQQILQKGGNAADAAIATASALNVTEPTSCGIGGDLNVLYYDASKKSVLGINGSGRTPKALSLDKIKSIGISGTSLPNNHIFTVTVPGAVAGMVDTLEKFGTMTLKDVMTPTVDIAEKGFPVSTLTAKFWAKGESKLKMGPNADEMLLNGKAPKAGEIMKLPYLAKTFRLIIEHGKAGFYQGFVADEIVKIVQSFGGVMTHEDLVNHNSSYEVPISTNYKNITIHEMPPNGQGLTALLALNILEECNIGEIEHLSTDYIHTLVESLRLAFAETRWYVTDPLFSNIPITELLSKKYAKIRKKLINPENATINVGHGSPVLGSDTVYLCTIDSSGNSCSLIYSNYEGFGTGLIPKNCGFTLQNRGANFSLQENHPNVIAPKKRPYHTIIPGIATYSSNDKLYCSFGVMGGFMQPQGHVQVLLNMIEYNMDPQAALDVPRFCILDGNSGGQVAIEEGISNTIINRLTGMGHDIIPISGIKRSIFGRGQIIQSNPNTGVYWAGSDPRADGCAIGW